MTKVFVEQALALPGSAKYANYCMFLTDRMGSFIGNPAPAFNALQPALNQVFNNPRDIDGNHVVLMFSNGKTTLFCQKYADLTVN